MELTAHDNAIIEKVRGILPDLSEHHHKGQHGRIGVLGGSEEYTGAPFFAGISALRAGADLVHIFCAQDAAQPIKSYSPDLIVHPLLDTPDAVEQILPWLQRLHVLVIGPGLGQNPVIMDNVKRLLETEEMKDKKLVVDADGLKLASDIFANENLTGIMTPNAMEWSRMGLVGSSRFVILKKGSEDEIVQDSVSHRGAAFRGASRRCGGQGDLLSGSIATLYHWGTLRGAKDAEVVACQGASLLIRLCNFEAFQRKGRGTLAVDMVEQIPVVFKKYFEAEN